MNRRHKKPQQTDYLAKVQNYWQQLIGHAIANNCMRYGCACLLFIVVA